MADDFDDDDFDQSGGGVGIVAMILPFATAIAALVLGAVLGFAVGIFVKPSETVEVQVPRDLTAAELQAACAPDLKQKVTELETAQTKVAKLESEVVVRERRVNELEAEMKRRAERGAALVRELEQARKDLAEAERQLVIAQEEKQQLIVELTTTKAELAETEEQLEEQIEKTERAKEDALVNKYYRFVNDAQLEICEKGNRKKMGQCRETVEANLLTDARRDRFAHCVRSGQATPAVFELEKKANLPDFAEMINEDAKQTKGWYVLFCDPTLPEKDEGFLNEDALPPTASP